MNRKGLHFYIGHMDLGNLHFLQDSSIAVIAADGFEEAELFYPVGAIKRCRAKYDIISTEAGVITGVIDGRWSRSIPVDKSIYEVDARQYDALIVPGGALSCDTLSENRSFLSFIKEFSVQQKAIAAISEGVQLLVASQVLDGELLTSPYRMRRDSVPWAEMGMVINNGFLRTNSREDLPTFISRMIDEFEQSMKEARSIFSKTVELARVQHS